ncbi:MAG TPA: hypothetical protein VGI12_05030 [Vicinamibacterales bacterium]
MRGRGRPHSVDRWNQAGFWRGALAHGLLEPANVIWFFQRDSELIVCEIRRAADNDDEFEFEVAGMAGPTTTRFESPRELIAAYLREQSRLLAAGWHPSSPDTLE